MGGSRRRALFQDGQSIGRVRGLAELAEGVSAGNV